MRLLIRSAASAAAAAGAFLSCLLVVHVVDKNVVAVAASGSSLAGRRRSRAKELATNKRALDVLKVTMRNNDEPNKPIATKAAPFHRRRHLLPVVKEGLALDASASSQNDRHRSLVVTAEQEMDCDQAFLMCLNSEKCVDCFLELQTHEVDWTTVSQNTPCGDVITFLNGRKHCTSITGEANAQQLFCNTFDSCVNWDEMDKRKSEAAGAEGDEEDNSIMDCNTLTECNWDGFRPSFIGDGICQEKMPGCYNSAVCNFDGGDCCEDTCEDPESNFHGCEHEGYFCRDPKSRECDPKLTTQCNYTIIDPPTDTAQPADPSSVDCAEGTTLYRLVMYDSFGDGWDSTKLTITNPEKKDASNKVYEGGLKSGSQGTEYICLSKTEASCYNVEAGGGTWGNEASWEIKPMTEGAPNVAGGTSPMNCNFPVAGGTCERTCDGKGNIHPEVDPEYKEFKDMYNCIEKQCPIQVGACQKDPVCNGCFAADSPDYCFAVDTFSAVIDCTLCQCSERKDSAFCGAKTAPGIVVPSSTETESHPSEVPCTPGEILEGSAAVLEFSKCTDFDEVAMTATEFDQDNFGTLDVFESCAHAFNNHDSQGGHTALGCLKILVDAKEGTGTYDAAGGGSGERKPDELIKALAKLLYDGGETFCDCSLEASSDCPLCPQFQTFKTLLYESMDACQALDEIDCDAWNEFHRPCTNNILLKYGKVDFSSKTDQCQYVKDGCGGAGPFPAFRRLDCNLEIPKAAWDFYKDFERGCVDGKGPATGSGGGGGGAGAGGGGSSPADLNPLPPPAVPASTPAAPANTQTTTTTTTTESAEKKQYVPPEERNKKEYKSPEDKKKGGRWFRNFLFLAVLGCAGFVYYKRRSDGFSFVRYRRMRGGFGGAGGGGGYGGDTDMYSGLAMESSTNFEPPSLPPPPTAMGGSSMMMQNPMQGSGMMQGSGGFS